MDDLDLYDQPDDPWERQDDYNVWEEQQVFLDREHETPDVDDDTLDPLDD